MVTNVVLVERKEVANGTMAFTFEKPAGFDYKPGQFVDITLTALADSVVGGNSRSLSLASAPSEPRLMVATRLRGTAFKEQLQEIPLGTAVQIDGPYGRLTLPEDATQPVVFLAGGIGITPFRSMIVQEAQSRSSRPLTLFFANRRVEDAPFHEELESLSRRHTPFRLVSTLSDPGAGAVPWRGETGYITAEMIRRHPTSSAGTGRRPIYYIVGPPKMVEAMRAVLNELHVPADEIRTEFFVGY
ncbi:MAG: FAD-dependent oxidoreductase [Nitrospiraceae bacterium]